MKYFFLFGSVSRLDVVFVCVRYTLCVSEYVTSFVFSVFVFVLVLVFVRCLSCVFCFEIDPKTMSSTQRHTDLLVCLPSSWTQHTHRHTRGHVHNQLASAHTQTQILVCNFNVFHSESLAKSSSNPLASKFLLYFAYTHTLAHVIYVCVCVSFV